VGEGVGEEEGDRAGDADGTDSDALDFEFGVDFVGVVPAGLSVRIGVVGTMRCNRGWAELARACSTTRSSSDDGVYESESKSETYSSDESAVRSMTVVPGFFLEAEVEVVLVFGLELGSVAGKLVLFPAADAFAPLPPPLFELLLLLPLLELSTSLLCTSLPSGRGGTGGGGDVVELLLGSRAGGGGTGGNGCSCGAGGYGTTYGEPLACSP